jgi:hypothetical protein
MKKILACVITRSLVTLFLLVPFMAAAQTPSSQPAASDQQSLKPGEIDALVAPIALYPDALLSVVLMASTYPLEVVQADRWVNENKSLKGDQLKDAADKQSWDDSVKQLVGTPSVLSMMAAKLDWTQKLGDAVLAQQPDVMDAVQRLRLKAEDNGKLKSTKEQTVTVKQEGDKQVVVIEPTSADTVYVPQYDPSVVYGDWPYAEYPPYYFGGPGYWPTGLLAGTIGFGAGYLVGRWASGGNIWGGGINWGNRNILGNRPANPIANPGNRWTHNPAHRAGVRYNNPGVQQRFGNNNIRSGSQQRLDFRGRNGQQVLNPSADRGNLGADRGNRGADRGNPSADRGNLADRGASNRAGPEQRAGNRQAGQQRAANRPSTANRGGAQRQARASTQPASRPSAPRRDTAFGNIQRGGAANLQSQRGRASLGGSTRVASGGGFRGGGGGFRGGGGGRRSDAALKHDITLLGHLDNGLGFYRFSYNGSDRAYVGVIAQEVRAVMPEAVVRGADGYLRVFYDKLGVTFESYDKWVASGAHIPSVASVHRDER